MSKSSKDSLTLKKFINRFKRFREAVETEIDKLEKSVDILDDDEAADIVISLLNNVRLAVVDADDGYYEDATLQMFEEYCKDAERLGREYNGEEIEED